MRSQPCLHRWAQRAKRRAVGHASYRRRIASFPFLPILPTQRHTHTHTHTHTQLPAPPLQSSWRDESAARMAAALLIEDHPAATGAVPPPAPWPAPSTSAAPGSVHQAAAASQPQVSPQDSSPLKLWHPPLCSAPPARQPAPPRSPRRTTPAPPQPTAPDHLSTRGPSLPIASNTKLLSPPCFSQHQEPVPVPPPSGAAATADAPAASPPGPLAQPGSGSRALVDRLRGEAGELSRKGIAGGENGLLNLYPLCLKAVACMQPPRHTSLI